MSCTSGAFRGLRVVSALLVVLAACGGDDEPTCEGAERCACYGNGTCDDGLSCLSDLCVAEAASGGEQASGGTAVSGGDMSGGSALSGGAQAETGGQAATGGEATGGSDATGGDSASGGESATGGDEATGGSMATGGDQATGGSMATGGDEATGGSMATGGDEVTGGSMATGGDQATGGTTTGGPKSLPELMAELPSGTAWDAYTLTYDTMYSAFIPGSSTEFKVPVRVQDPADETQSLLTSVVDWAVLPSGTVGFEHDARTGGIILTVLDYAPVVLVTYNDGLGSGGTAVLHLTPATEVQLTAGALSYDSGSEPDLSFLTEPTAPPLVKPPSMTQEEFDALWTAYLDAQENLQPIVEGDQNCDSCHGPNAMYFGIAATPTQTARLTDAELLRIMTHGEKPAGIGFRVLPPEFFGQPRAEVYASYHKRDGSLAELQALIIYLRSLTPLGLDDIQAGPGD